MLYISTLSNLTMSNWSTWSNISFSFEFCLILWIVVKSLQPLCNRIIIYLLLYLILLCRKPSNLLIDFCHKLLSTVKHKVCPILFYVCKQYMFSELNSAHTNDNILYSFTSVWNKQYNFFRSNIQTYYPIPVIPY